MGLGPMMQTAITFLSGANTFGFLIAGLLLLRAWRKTRDFLFLSFSSAFVLLAFNQAAMAIGTLTDAEQVWVFVLRLLAFLLLILAIVAKNVEHTSH
jgi:hypothetical protein